MLKTLALCALGLSIFIAGQRSQRLLSPPELNLRLEPVHVAYAPYSVPLSFGETVRGNNVVIANVVFREPVVVIGDSPTFVSDTFLGNEWGVYVASPSQVWLKGNIAASSPWAFGPCGPQ